MFKAIYCIKKFSFLFFQERKKILIVSYQMSREREVYICIDVFVSKEMYIYICDEESDI